MAGLSQQQELVQLRKRARRRLVGAIVLVLVSTAVLWNVVGAIPDQKMKPEAIEIVGLETSQPAAAPVPAQPASAPQADAASAPLEALPPAGATELPAALPEDGTVVPLPATPAPAQPSAAAKPVLPLPSVTAAVAPQPAPKPAPKPEPKPVPKPAPKPEPKPKAAPERDPLAILEGRASFDEHKAPAKAAEASPQGTRYMVQLAALSDPAKVDALRARLASNGLSASFSKVTTSKGEVVRVRMGPFASRQEADAALARLSRAGVSGIVVSK
ncbi:SPOR domain-containing protein [Crenobacter caeni]|uniref:SPOR domain-containing protein n=1 Tax=Crenobacter caeni TaxID=2705474 RepID=A0A6B2KPZ5_9NEIS|nr:SPOR domain-containing protein [Crenobacter caeni]NDV12220.1 SPOR domain-containing protein [Crenobacter caeni]